MKNICLISLLSVLLFSNICTGESFTQSKSIFLYKINSTFYKVKKKNEHQPFIKTLSIEYRCSPIETWQNYYSKYGLCNILESNLDTKDGSFLIKVYQEADHTDYAKRCTQTSLATLKITAKDLCSASIKEENGGFGGN